jgi:iron complex transport system permease protein
VRLAPVAAAPVAAAPIAAPVAAAPVTAAPAAPVVAAPAAAAAHAAAAPVTAAPIAAHVAAVHAAHVAVALAALRVPGRLPARRVLGGLAIALGVAVVVAIGRGAVPLSPGEVLGALAGRAHGRVAAIVWSVRLPRVVLAVLVGGALGGAGAALQGLARNPLADPALIGISGGASVGAIGWLTLAPLLSPGALAAVGAWALPAAAFVGALGATLLAVRLARAGGGASPASFVLGGIALAAVASSIAALLLYLADDAALRSITFWSLGSCGGATWAVTAAAAIPIGVALALLGPSARDLDRLALGEAEARHLGVDVDRLVRRTAILAALAVGAAVAACGSIAFVGLLVPVVARSVLGPAHRVLLPASILGGALLLVVADLAARSLVAPAELPVGVLTSLAGAPAMFALVRRGAAGVPA